MNELFYPTLDLFIYDLRSPINADAREIADNLQAFRARLPPDTNIQDSNQETEYLELTHPSRPKLTPQNPNLEGYLYPVRLNDTYGLQIDCSVNNLTEPQPSDSFNTIKAEIETYSSFNPLTIGQTWLLSGWLTQENQDSEKLAKDCYESLYQKNSYKKDQFTQELYGKGTFLNSQLFEIWQSQSYPNDHLMILISPDQATARKAAQFYTDWMGLFCYRHKITWAYHQSRLIKEALVNHYKKVEENADSIKQNQNQSISITRLQQIFNNIQTILNTYTIDLLNLAFQKQIIEINLTNYRTRVELIKQKAKAENSLNSDLIFLDQFGDLAETKYLPQIAKDNDNMRLGLQLLESNINALRSQIELEKAERDRNFQNLVTIVGAGTAVVSVFDFEDKKCERINKSLDNKLPCDNFLVSGILTPFLLLLVFGLMFFGFKKFYQAIQAIIKSK